jgi:septal ring factor EnvC (AmiA/AmiB activator)
MAEDRNYTDILLEEMRENFRTISEGIADIKRQTLYIPQLRHDVRDLKEDMKTVKAALTDTNKELREMRKQVNDHEHRITHLEAA